MAGNEQARLATRKTGVCAGEEGGVVKTRSREDGACVLVDAKWTCVRKHESVAITAGAYGGQWGQTVGKMR
ncbi:uncharacterized protein SPSK_10814 [Sporothrix schenckii 1099-18]|uniref:Uncharacterized protein n=1 Tax=Sporothrix schenckii 1099-18 TaxID=1397361 RepID=A0A0F2ME60_SPOSC|nr:uncharacterized protein SPSK_10814 [Sporothrix schenckii 1099-18]KJR87948.1 hypothetical protein SPSK_10814 [Sporothrix schenckii 1099-18]